MGWTSERSSKQSLRQLTDQDIWDKVQSITYSWMNIAMAHLHRTSGQTGDYYEVYLVGLSRKTGNRFIMVLLLDIWEYQGAHEIGWKEIEESMGPAYHNCPKEFFKWVEAPNDYAKNWRKECEQRRVKAHRIDLLCHTQ